MATTKKDYPLYWNKKMLYFWKQGILSSFNTICSGGTANIYWSRDLLHLRESSSTRTRLACDVSKQPKTARIPHMVTDWKWKNGNWMNGGAVWYYWVHRFWDVLVWRNASPWLFREQCDDVWAILRTLGTVGCPQTSNIVNATAFWKNLYWCSWHWHVIISHKHRSTFPAKFFLQQ